MTITVKDNRIALAGACESGNLNLVKYLIHLGADIKMMKRMLVLPTFLMPVLVEF